MQSALIEVLSVSPLEEDHGSLQGILNPSTWKIFQAGSLTTALAVLERQMISVVVCECDLMPGTWIDLLAAMNSTEQPASLVVTSKLADERLWSEALNLGAWDVLAKPFDRTEVSRCLSSAWHHRSTQNQVLLR